MIDILIEHCSEPYRFISARGLHNLPDKDTDPLGICQHLKLYHSLPLVWSLLPLGASLFLFYHSSQASPFLVFVLRMIQLIS